VQDKGKTRKENGKGQKEIQERRRSKEDGRDREWNNLMTPVSWPRNPDERNASSGK
jgi:hypothetical protein